MDNDFIKNENTLWCIPDTEEGVSVFTFIYSGIKILTDNTSKDGAN